MSTPPPRRRRLRWPVLALLFFALPILEIYLIVQLGQVVGAWWTIFILLADGAFGAWLVRREGSRAWHALQKALSTGRMPSRELADGALILVGGALLVTPGFITDGVGLFCILPFTRSLARRGLARAIAARLTVVGMPGGPGFPGSSYDQARRPGQPEGREDVVSGEVVEDDPPS